uniref:Peptidase S1 domain-containing protein n=1 Tax=Caenorhabditis tropicalis TaxID=1561998 RepID=A0A1I7UXT9_9PELO
MDYQDGKNLTFSEKDGLVKVETKNVTEPYPTMGFFISNRHILTSAHSVLTKNLEWRFGGNPWDKDSKFPQDVPNDVRDRLSVQLGEGCGNDCVKMIKSAKLIGREPENDFDGVSAMLLIELNDNQTNVNFPCLSDEKVPIIVGETVDTYGFNNTGADWELFHNTTTVKEQKKKEQWICVTSYYTLDARGGPLLKNVSGKATVIGLTANTEINITVNYVYFFDLGSYSKVICDSSGVCAAKEETTTISNTIAVLPEENTTENRITSTSMIPKSQISIEKESTKKPINFNIDGYGLDEKDVESEDIWKDIRDTNEYYLKKQNRKSSDLFSIFTYFFAISSIYF